MKNSQAKAGFPKPNLENHLHELVMDYGFSVVVRMPPPFGGAGMSRGRCLVPVALKAEP
jgi:hypothetical protein